MREDARCADSAVPAWHGDHARCRRRCATRRAGPPVHAAGTVGNRLLAPISRPTPPSTRRSAGSVMVRISAASARTARRPMSTWTAAPSPLTASPPGQCSSVSRAKPMPTSPAAPALTSWSKMTARASAAALRWSPQRSGLQRSGSTALSSRNSAASGTCPTILTNCSDPDGSIRRCRVLASPGCRPRYRSAWG
jgi:hypothetical protein